MYFQDFDFMRTYEAVLKLCEQWGKTQAKIPKQMKTFDESLKSKKTVASMIEKKGGEDKKQVKKKEVNFVEKGIIIEHAIC